MVETRKHLLPVSLFSELFIVLSWLVSKLGFQMVERTWGIHLEKCGSLDAQKKTLGEYVRKVKGDSILGARIRCDFLSESDLFVVRSICQEQSMKKKFAGIRFVPC